MSADFWAGYISGAAGIIIGNPLDIIKVNLQRSSIEPVASAVTSSPPPPPPPAQSNAIGATVKGTAAPILGYGALNALMFMTYNRSMSLMDQDPALPTSFGKVWLCGAAAGLATFVVSCPTELIKCRAQVSRDGLTSWAITKDIWRSHGLRGLYWGASVTSLRDSVGYGFYFWSYELSKKAFLSSTHSEKPEWMSVLLCGGIAGVVTWASVFPLDVIKTRLQTQDLASSTSRSSTEQSALLPPREARLTATQIATKAYQEEGVAVFFRGLGVCSLRAFFVNAVQWAIYEYLMALLQPKPSRHSASIAL